MTDIHVTDETFAAEVLAADVPVIVDFWAPWCGPCRMVAPVLAELAVEYAGRIKIVEVNADENPVIVGQYGVLGLPTLNFYSGGELLRSLSGARPKQIVAQEIEAVLAEVASGGAEGSGDTAGAASADDTAGAVVGDTAGAGSGTSAGAGAGTRSGADAVGDAGAESPVDPGTDTLVTAGAGASSDEDAAPGKRDTAG